MGLFKRQDRGVDDLIVQRPALGNVKGLVEMAREAHAQAQAQMAQVAKVQQSGGGIGALMTALGMRYSTDYVKRTDCPSCGAPKRLPSATAYLYCDYCGALADYDFRRACEDAASAMPGPAYVQLLNSSRPKLEAAKAAGDRAGYRSLQQQIFTGYTESCPKALSHRLGDPAYSAQLVDYLAESSVVNDFDPAFSAVMDEMKTKAATLEWTGGLMERRTGGATFRALVDVCMRQSALADKLAASNGLMELDPDHAPQPVRQRMFRSLFSQGWLPMLNEDDAGWLIAEFGIGGEYTKIEPIADGESRHCGVCGGDLTVLPGAKAVVCNGCGHTLDVGGAQMTCRGCGGGVTFPVGVNRLNCPYCKADTERVGWT
jgi:hypothetical protein